MSTDYTPSLPLAPAERLGFQMKEDDLGHKGTPARAIFVSERCRPAAVIKALWMSWYMKHWCTLHTHLPSTLVISSALPAIMINCLFSYSTTITEHRKPLHFDTACQNAFLFWLSASITKQGCLDVPFPEGKSCWGYSLPNRGVGPGAQNCLGECKGVFGQSWYASWNRMPEINLVQILNGSN